MIIDLEVPVWTVKEPTVYTVATNEGRDFPILLIDKDSYIVGAKVESGINYDWETGVYNLQVGKYSSIAENVLFMIDMNHDYQSVFQGCISAIRDGNTQKQKLKRKGQIIIENDCWIGHGATIMGGVTVHNGAVVAANATVTKDVPPYAIVGGNPAKLIGYRFEKDIIEKLLDISWWDWSDEKIMEYERDLRGEVREFVDKMGKEQFARKSEIDVQRLTEGSLFVYYLDMREPYPVWQKVLDEFITEFDGTENELLLYLNPLEPEAEKSGEKLLQMLQKYESKNCYINICSEELEDDTILLAGADYYITNRQKENIKRMCIAERMGVQCISGVDTNTYADIVSYIK